MTDKEPKHPMTMSDVARAMGVAQSTVSRALRKDPQISKALGEKIREEAKRLGYRPNPFVSAFTAQIRSYRRTPNKAVTAFLHCYPKRARAFDQPYALGAKARMEELGFVVDDIYLDDFEGSLRALSKALWTRSISGMLVLPVPPGFDLTGMNFDTLAVATLDSSLKTPAMHRASPDYFQGMRLALDTLLARGYERIAFCTYQGEIDHIGARWMACYQFWKSQHKLAKLAPYVAKDWSREKFEKWLKKERPDVIVSNDIDFHKWLIELGLKVPDDVAFASLSVGPSVPGIAGIDQRQEDVGAAAVDLIVGQIHRNEFGLPSVPKRVSVEGHWKEGKTVRAAEMTLRKTSGL